MKQALLDAIAWARGSEDLDLLWDLINDLEDFLRETETMNDANLADDSDTMHVTADEIEDMIQCVALAHFVADLAANNGSLTGGSWLGPVAYATDGMLSSIAADAEDILERDDLDEIFEWGEFARDVSRAYEALADAHGA